MLFLLSHFFVVVAPSIIKKGRGKAVGNVLEKATRGGRRVPVTIPDGKFKPVGDWAAVFTSEVGVICRQWALLTAKNWAEITDEDKKVLYQRILVSENKFTIQYPWKLFLFHQLGIY